MFGFLENTTSIEYDSKYLNNFLNISNAPPEIIDYYDLDVVASGDDIGGGIDGSTPLPEIYPDPEKLPPLKQSKDDHEHSLIDKLNDIIQHGGDGIGSSLSDGEGELLDVKNEDFKEHDTIDNIMYIYYGSNGAMQKSFGGSVIIVGAVFALGAQILAIILSMLRNR